MTMFLVGTEKKEGGKDVGDDDNVVGKTCDGDNADGDNSDGIANNFGGIDSNDVVNPPDSGDTVGEVISVSDANNVGKSCDGDNGDGDNSDGIVNNIGGNDSNDVVNPPGSFCSLIADGSNDCENSINSSVEDDKSCSSDQFSNESDSDNDDVGATPSRGKNAKSLLNLRQRILPTAKNRGKKTPKLHPNTNPQVNLILTMMMLGLNLPEVKMERVC